MHQVNPLSKLFADRQARSSMAIFQVQLPQQIQVKTEKRGQQPFAIPSKAEIRETMLSFGPPLQHCPKDAKFQNVDRALGQLSQFGILPACVVNASLERQGLPTLRYQTLGKKEVATMSSFLMGYCFYSSYVFRFMFMCFGLCHVDKKTKENCNASRQHAPTTLFDLNISRQQRFLF
jgi:hypothetical protein